MTRDDIISMAREAGAGHGEKAAEMCFAPSENGDLGAGAELRRLREENEALAAWQCIYTDGSGLTGDESGSQVCMKDVLLRQALEALDELMHSNSTKTAQHKYLAVTDAIRQHLEGSP